MRYVAGELTATWRAAGTDPAVPGAEHALRRGSVRALPAARVLDLRRRPGVLPRRGPAPAGGAGAMTMETAPDRRPKLAVWKFASCDGCQLTLLNCEDELLDLAGEIEIAYFPEATRAVVGRSLRPLAGRGVGDHRRRRGAHPAGPAELTTARHDRRVRHRGRHPGTAQLRRRRRVPCDRLRAPGVRRDAGQLHRRSPPMSRSTSSCAAARSTRRSCSRSSRHSCSTGGLGSPARASAWSASAAATSASPSPTAPRASVRSPTPGAARSVRRTTAAAMGASGPRTPRTRRR